jgi:hypothetical protein
MFNLLAASDARSRMDEFERFLEFWYGPRRPEFGEPESRLQILPLPYPLRRFYAFAGRWPSPGAIEADQWFYQGACMHHLFPLDNLEVNPDGRLRFFMEYQGDWEGLTLLDEDDPPVWIEGSWTEGDEEITGKRKRVETSLSRFLVTHCLMSTVYEDDNAVVSGFSKSLDEWFRKFVGEAIRIWDTEGCDCPWFEGDFFLFPQSILVHRISDFRHHQFAARKSEGVALVKSHLTSRN